MDSIDPALKKLRWRCRRGMRELDQVFERYLDHGWAKDSDAQRGIFLRLLDMEDDTLWRWIMGYDTCNDTELATFIERLRVLRA